MIRPFAALIASQLLLASAAQAAPTAAATGVGNYGGGFGVANITAPKITINKSQADAPALIEADAMEYDRASELVTASGSVSVVQGQSVLMADVLTYQRSTGEVAASGNVSLLEASGHVMFADRMQLKQAMKTGVIEHFKSRLSDGSLLAANYVDKVSENVTHLFRAAYTPCRILCTEDGPLDPLWSVKAGKVVYDEDEQTVRYRDAYFNTFGVPVFYTPYLSHSTPGAENQSGFLMPQYRYNSNLGSTYRAPYYYVFGQDKDATITPMWTATEGLVMLGQYRQAFNSGRMNVSGSITRPQNRDSFGNPTNGTQTRGYLDASGRFKIDEQWDWGFDIKRASDETYLRRYFNDATPVLNSRAFIQGFGVGGNERGYASAQALSFQGLQGGADSNLIPLVLPMLDFSTQTEADDLGGRFKLDANMMSLTRSAGGTGSRRMAALGRWNLPYLTDNGQLIELGVQTRADIYSVNDVQLEDGRKFDGATGRLVPEVNALWRWPFINRLGEQTTWVIEPTVALAISPGGGNPAKIPNEDSQIPEFTDGNLFSFNRFSGWDRIETGPRITYGVRSELTLGYGKSINMLLGQQYRLNDNRLFPFSNDLESNNSDYVGRFGFNYDLFALSYRFRFDRERLAAKRQELDASAVYKGFTTTISYLSLQNDPVLNPQEEIVGGVTYELTKNWSVNTSARNDLQIGQLTQVAGGVVFKNECVALATMLARDYTRDRDVKPSTSFSVQLMLQNLGSAQ